MSLRSCDAISPPPIFGYSSIKMSIDGTAKDGSQLLRSTSVTSSLVVVSRVASESLKDFLLDLHHLSRKCIYPNVEEQLRHVFAFGIRDANIRQKLLATKELGLVRHCLQRGLCCLQVEGAAYQSWSGNIVRPCHRQRSPVARSRMLQLYLT